ncbi:MAG: AMP-binding protein [Ignavibacterium sp.]|nr:AMP-binding protein [Ignavibacterium sp.]
MFIKPSEKTALIWKDENISYNEVLKNISAYSSLLTLNNFSKAAILSENRPEWIFAFYAGWKKKACIVPIDYMSSVDDVAFILNDCKPEYVFYSDTTRDTIQKVVSKISYEPFLINIDEIKTIKAEVEFSFPERDLNDTAVIIYTSGTTGSPKGVMLSFDNLLVNIEAVSKDVEIYKPEDKVLILLPLHHIFPLAGTAIITLSVGATAVFSPSMSSEDLIATLQKHGISVIIGVPRLYNLIRKGIRDKIDKSAIAKLLFKVARKKNSLSFSRKIFKKVHDRFGGNIKYLVSGGAALDPEVAKDFTTLGFEILEGFGMTETAPMITFTRPGEVYPGSAGRPLTTNEVKVIDGEIVNRGRNVMKGYYNRPEETADIIKDGWLHTGDLGYLDEKNRIFITGRKKEIIILSNGKNINPEEVEIKLASMSDLINEVGVFEKNDMLHAVIYPEYQKAKQKEIDNLEEYLTWNVIDKYNQSVTPYKKVMKFSLIKEPLPRTRLSKLKRFLLPELETHFDEKKKSAAEPDIKEYKLIKEFIQANKEVTVHPTDHMEIDLGLDSLDKVNLIVYLESTFGITLQETELLNFSNIQKLAEYIKDKKTKLNVEAVDWNSILKEHLDIDLPESWFTHNLIKNSAKVFLRFYFRLKGEGIENIPDGPFILAPNHQSFIDGLFVAVFLKNKLMKKTYFYAKEKHIKQGWLKFIANKNNVIVMDLSDLKSSLQKLASVLKKEKNIIIFPEGTRTRDGEIGSFKKTFAILARELNIPVVPVAIDGAYDAMPRGKKIPRPMKKINVKFLEPVYPGNETYDSLKDKVFEMVSNSLKKK